MHSARKRRNLLTAALTLLVLLADVSLPLGVAGGIAYVVPVLASTGLRSPRSTLFWAAVATILSGVGCLLSPDGAAVEWHVLANRVIAIGVVWLSAYFAIVSVRGAHLKQQAQLLAQAIAKLGEGVIITDEQLEPPGPRMAFVNEALCRITGYSAEELLGKSPRILQGEATDRETLARIKRELQCLRGCRAELVNYRKDGSTYICEVFIAPLFDHRQRCTHYVAIHRDITERKEAERALQMSEERRSLILRTTFDGVWDCDLVQRTITWDDTYDQLFGPRPSHTGNSWEWWTERIHDEDRNHVLRSLQEALEGGADHWRAQYRLRRSDNSYAYVMDQASIVRDASGKARRVLGAMLDVSQQERAKQAVTASEVRLRAILETAADSIITTDFDGRITSVNSTTTSVFGYSRDELLGQDIRLLMPLSLEQELRQKDNQSARSARAPVREIRARRRDGTTFPADLAVSEMPNHGFTGIVRDISEKKQLEEYVAEVSAEEQRRIGQELHDGTSQVLTGLTLLSGGLREMLSQATCDEQGGQSRWCFTAGKYESMRETVTRLSEGLSQVNRQVHELAHGIMPVQIDAEGLRSALEDLAAATDTHAGIECRFHSRGSVAVPDNRVATHLYRIAQEALNNSLRHGQADCIEIVLAQVEGYLVLEVHDNGVGFVPGSVGRGGRGKQGMGLRTMSYRAGICGGDLQIHRKDEQGTLVRCSIPIGASGDENQRGVQDSGRRRSSDDS